MQCSVSQSSPRNNCAGTRGKQQTPGWGDTVSWRADGRLDAVYPASGQHQSPSLGTSLHQNLPLIYILQLTTTTTEKGRKRGKRYPPNGGIKKKKKKIFLNVAFLQCFEGSQPGELHVPRAWASTLNLPGEKKEKPNPSCNHRWMVRWWQSHSSSVSVLSLLSSCPIASVSMRKIMKMIIWTSHLLLKNYTQVIT